MPSPVDRSITVSAPYLRAAKSFASSHSVSLDRADLPILALIFVRAAMPMPIGLSPLARCTLLAGMTKRPRATSARTNSGWSCSSRATDSISGVITPARACSSWVISSCQLSVYSFQFRQPAITESYGIGRADVNKLAGPI